jgi:uncharacterized protein YbjT (DUF2867 family)
MQYPRLLILGGTGRTGKKLIQQALERGYNVTALARDGAALADLANPELTVIQGSPSDRQCFEKTLDKGFDAVLSTLGIFQKEPGTPLADMTIDLLAALQERGPKRFIVMSSLGVGDSAGQGNLSVKFVTRFILKYVLIDKSAQEALLRESGLQWSVLRPPRLMNNDQQRPVQIWQGTNHPRPLRWQISTLDAASQMLELLENPASIKQAFQCSY